MSLCGCPVCLWHCAGPELDGDVAVCKPAAVQRAPPSGIARVIVIEVPVFRLIANMLLIYC